jgi:succinate dehydrogenase/fumarate reductase flavoprotein subunit
MKLPRGRAAPSHACWICGSALQRHDVDVLVVGAGLAGLATVLSAESRHVTLLCPQLPPAATASALAQGGIAAAVGKGDSAVSNGRERALAESPRGELESRL